MASDNTVVSPAIGGGSKFGSNDWWDVSAGKRWWNLPASGLASDVMCDAGTVGDLAVVAGTVRGWKHQIAGTQNEDSFFVGSAVSTTGKKYAVAVLSDGLSSAKFSGYSARRVTQIVGRRLASCIADTSEVDAPWVDSVLTPILRSAATSVVDFDGDDYGVPTVPSASVGERDVLVTVTVLVIEADLSPGGARKAVAGFIGDSPVFVLSNGTWTRKSAGDDEVMVENRTRAFPVDTTCELVEFAVGIDDTVVLTSDGVGNFIGSGDRTLALGAFLKDQWSRPVSVLTFLNHLSFDLRSADDDRTAIAVWSAVQENVGS